MIATATAAMASRRPGLASDADREGHDGRGDQHRDQVHHLDQRVDRRAGGVLERVADGVADDGRGVRLASPCRRGGRPRRASWRCPRRRRSWPGRRPSGCRWRWRRPGSRPAGRRRGRSRPRSGRGSPAGRGWPARAASRGCRCRRRGRTPDFSVQSMIPGWSRNWRRTSKTIAPAARVTALIARPENRNTTAAPMITPTRVFGLNTSKLNAGAGLVDRDARRAQRAVDGVAVGAEQRGRGEHRRRDRDALGDRLGGVADRVELGEDLDAGAA